MLSRQMLCIGGATAYAVLLVPYRTLAAGRRAAVKNGCAVASGRCSLPNILSLESHTPFQTAQQRPCNTC
jgi:hypothetical protein